MEQLVVIGGGASGMMAAVTAARKGADVLILEHKDRMGKKILSTGNGRCNFTNTQQEPQFYRSSVPGFAWKVLQHFDVQETIRFFLELGIYSRNRNGYLYPNSDQASAVLEVLRMELRRLNVRMQTETEVLRIHNAKYGSFRIETDRGNIESRQVILAAGSKATPVTGSDGSGYILAEGLGHSCVPVVPALVQLKCSEKFFKALTGVRVQGKVRLYTDGACMAEDTGEIQLTDYGISGIPVFQVSRYAAYAVMEHKKIQAVLDFAPDFTKEQYTAFLRIRRNNSEEKNAEEFMVGLFHKKLAGILLEKARIDRTFPAFQITEKELTRLTEAIKCFTVNVTGTNSFAQAQICAGGIDVTEIDPASMESLKVPGLYFAGEIVDVDGICGGYNLQWAWSSGYVAGTSAADCRMDGKG